MPIKITTLPNFALNVKQLYQESKATTKNSIPSNVAQKIALNNSNHMMNMLNI
jgi:hypothetical protein